VHEQFISRVLVFSHFFPEKPILKELQNIKKENNSILKSAVFHHI